MQKMMALAVLLVAVTVFPAFAQDASVSASVPTEDYSSLLGSWNSQHGDRAWRMNIRLDIIEVRDGMIIGQISGQRFSRGITVPVRDNKFKIQGENSYDLTVNRAKDGRVESITGLYEGPNNRRAQVNFIR